MMKNDVPRIDPESFQDISRMSRNLAEMFLNHWKLPETTKNIKQMRNFEKWSKNQKMIKKMKSQDSTFPEAV